MRAGWSWDTARVRRRWASGRSTCSVTMRMRVVGDWRCWARVVAWLSRLRSGVAEWRDEG